MPRPSLDHERIREELLETGREMIRQRGAVDIALSDIATACGMSQSNIYRFFESKEAFYEAMAGSWFEELHAVMVQVVESDLPIKEKFFQFFARRLVIIQQRYADDPDLFNSYMEIGERHWDVVRGFVDLADHYMASIVSEAMAEGYFEGLELDHALSLINLMVQPFTNANLMRDMDALATEDNLHIVMETIFAGLAAHKRNEPGLSVIRNSAD